MDTYELIARCRAQSRDWAKRLLELDCQQSELLAQSHEAIGSSRKILDSTRLTVEGQTYPYHGKSVRAP
jgi:hypothetical protein